MSFGSLYPALARLERAGAVKAVEARDPRRPAVPLTGSLGGELAAFRARKSWAGPTGAAGARRCTASRHRGEALFEELLAAESQSSDDDRVFNLRLAFARYLPADARLGHARAAAGAAAGAAGPAAGPVQAVIASTATPAA